MTDYLVDNSVWSRVAQQVPRVLARVNAIVASPSDAFVTCPPQVLEFCHSAPPDQHERYVDAIMLGFPLEHHPNEHFVLGIQQALWSHGLHRAAGPTDILIASYAILNEATVLACDQDYSHIARVDDRLAYEYLSP
ncbi:PIN domain-containing protein [Zhihengliuella halotolerans]|uniref:PIN domain-containing protein n=1 Tax=Zhihengliuella halotolerans TaxID=370736 RepID=A0A4Q8ADL0_9MICC|nr:PIN domain-containing protein [Zhihengliuella halotolerans]RZU62224.1 hypothetical protein EV380_1815 [Zhihengliuella halotolerans]